jgi:uroporphyrinogen III methyltransferase/synthase
MFGDKLHQLKKETAFFSIGPLTSETIRKHDFEVALEPENSTLDDLVTAMIDYYQKP